MRALRFLAVALIFAALALAPVTAFADPGDEAASAANIDVVAPAQAALGEKITVRATLTGAAGLPVAGAPVNFLIPASWGEEIQGEMLVGTATTGADGIAVAELEMRRSGDVAVIARFAGNERFTGAESKAAVKVEGEYQLYTPKVGIEVRGLGSWVLAAAVGTVWSLYFVVALFVLAIARSAREPATEAGPQVSRRRFLGRMLVPVGMQSVAATGGLGLVTLVARSPHTHGSLHGYTTASHYHRTPFALVSGDEAVAALPPVLDREVSFRKEVLAILKAKAGPHVYLPENSPPPGGIRLDSYESIMAIEQLVVPGKPEESTLVKVLFEPAMQMPPSLPPLPEAERQLIVSWVAQGAKNN